MWSYGHVLEFPFFGIHSSLDCWWVGLVRYRKRQFSQDMVSLQDIQAGLVYQKGYLARTGVTNVSRVALGLYLGDRVGADDESLLREHNIRAFVSLTSPAERVSGTRRADYARWGIEHLQLFVTDFASSRIDEHFEPGTRFIQKHRRQARNVYVHCGAGISRSATMVLYFLLHHIYERDPEIDAYVERRELVVPLLHAYLRCKRPVVDPNVGFCAQLREAEERLKSARLDARACLQQCIDKNSDADELGSAKEKIRVTN